MTLDANFQGLKWQQTKIEDSSQEHKDSRVGVAAIDWTENNSHSYTRYSRRWRDGEN